MSSFRAKGLIVTVNTITECLRIDCNSLGDNKKTFFLRHVTDTTFALWTHVFSSELYRKYTREIRRISPVRCTNKRTERRIVNSLCWLQNCLSILYRADSQLLRTRSLDFKYFKTILKHTLANVKCFESDSSCCQLRTADWVQNFNTVCQHFKDETISVV